MTREKKTALCPSCGTIQRLDGECSICGYPMREHQYVEYETCHKCGKARPLGQRCPYCGDPARGQG